MSPEPALFRNEAKNGMSDAAAKHRSIREKPRCRRRGFDKQAKGSAARFLFPALADKKQKTTGAFGLQAETPALRQPEAARIATDLEHHRRKSPARERRIGKPERVLETARYGMEKFAGPQAVIGKPWGIGQAGFTRDETIADPQYPLIWPGRPSRQAKPQPEAADRARIAKLCPAGLDHRSFGKALRQKVFEACRLPPPNRWAAMRSPGAWFRHRFEPAGKRLALDPGYGFAQGKKPLLRQSGRAHDVSPVGMFSICS
ncbi:MAG: hypothetical protein H5U11_08850 [Rhizobium sp.]|nr:hypothetical protein [Rhizobium sp.]